MTRVRGNAILTLDSTGFLLGTVREFLSGQYGICQEWKNTDFLIEHCEIFARDYGIFSQLQRCVSAQSMS